MDVRQDERSKLAHHRLDARMRLGLRHRHCSRNYCCQILCHVSVSASMGDRKRATVLMLRDANGCRLGLPNHSCLDTQFLPRPLVKRSAAITVVNMAGSTATIYGSYMWPSSSGLRYVPGGSATAAIPVLVVLLALLIRIIHVPINKELEEAENEGRRVNYDRHETQALVFRYIV